MRHLDLTFPSPAENLACDEALLDWCESGEGAETMRFWESPEPFVVVGYANKVETEVNVAACEARKIPILRRCSGGGTVVQGPGCLNYTLVLHITKDGPLHSIAVANQFIMRRNRAAIQTLNPQPSTLNCAVRGHTDLAIGGRKFSGNSQRRRKHFLLFHGTFLLNFDLALIGDLLLMPSKEPDYRESRKHADFLTNINVSAEMLKAALQKAWGADSLLTNPPLQKIRAMTLEKYSTNEWNFKF
ncbi:MAG: lipoate--protein ligase family protein [Verrucomicrobiota bacterium]